jgi:hypothetical protein
MRRSPHSWRISPPLRVFACVLLLLFPASLFALSRVDLDRAVDFSVTLKNLAAVAAGKEPLPAGRAVVLSGTVSDVNVLDKSEAGYRVRIELMAGEWIGQDEVRAYACYVDFTGAEYLKLIPPRPPRAPTPGVVGLNSRVVVIGNAVEVVSTPLGEKRVVVQGLHIRPIE